MGIGNLSSLIDDTDEGGTDAGLGNTPEFSVSELSGAVKRTVEGAFSFVRVRGEVGRVSRPRSGHVYLDLKDDRAVLAGVIWKGVANGLTTQPEEGMEVVATGRLTTFPGQSRYQIVIEQLAPAGVGALMAMLEKRRKVLAAEGLFDETRKRMLPFLPRVVGVVTSPSGAVIRDILHRFSERFPVHVLVWPVAVQGERCAPEVTAAIRGFSNLAPDGAVPKPDVIIVARGGGSVEDLWGFNDENVVRAAADSAIPVVSAVGHETDTTLIDYAADRRAPTPTAAAEICVPVRGELAALIADLQARRLRSQQAILDRRRQRLTDLARALPRPQQILSERRQRLDVAAMGLPQARALTREQRHALGQTGARLGPALQSRAALARLALTGAAALIAPSALTQRVNHAASRLTQGAARLGPALQNQTNLARLGLTRIAAGLGPTALAQRTAYFSARLAQTSDRLDPVPRRRILQASDQLAALRRTLNTLSYRGTLARGFAVVRSADGSVLSQAKAVSPGADLAIEFNDATVQATVTEASATPPTVPKKRTAKRAKKTPPDDSQGSLF